MPSTPFCLSMASSEPPFSRVGELASFARTRNAIGNGDESDMAGGIRTGGDGLSRSGVSRGSMGCSSPGGVAGSRGACEPRCGVRDDSAPGGVAVYDRSKLLRVASISISFSLTAPFGESWTFGFNLAICPSLDFILRLPSFLPLKTLAIPGLSRFLRNESRSLRPDGCVLVPSRKYGNERLPHAALHSQAPLESGDTNCI